nr:putative reverse transcriptase domain-containing protein [Tanacetum cinerariifolium]
MAPNRRSDSSNDENPDIVAIIANGKNGGNNGCSYKTFLACNPRDYVGKSGAISLTRWIEKIEFVIENSRCAKNQKGILIGSMSWLNCPTLGNALIKAHQKDGILTDEAICCCTLTKSSEKRKEVEETSKQGCVITVRNRVTLPEIVGHRLDRWRQIICDCKLELGNSLFTIDLIPLGHGSFDVIIRMDRLSKNKAEIVCHEKVVRIPLEGGEVLRV